MFKMFGRAWRREEKLWKVFWLLGFVFPVVYWMILGVVAGVAGGGIAFILFVGSGFLSVLYLIYWIVIVWRCRKNASGEHWGYIALIYIIVGPCMILPGLLVGGVLVAGDLVAAAEIRVACQQQYEQLVSQGALTVDQKEQFLDECKQATLAKHNEAE